MLKSVIIGAVFNIIDGESYVGTVPDNDNTNCSALSCNAASVYVKDGTEGDIGTVTELRSNVLIDGSATETYSGKDTLSTLLTAVMPSAIEKDNVG
jgi:hypothetical protein